MSISIIKLPVSQDEEEVNIFCKKNEIFDLKKFLKKLGLKILVILNYTNGIWIIKN